MVDKTLFEESMNLGYDIFQTKYRHKFDYIYDSRHRFDESRWVGDCLDTNGEWYFALYHDWREGHKLVSGDLNTRYLCLLERAYLRRMLKPSTTADEIYWNLYEEVYGQGYYECRRVIDNSDKAINRGHLKKIAEEVMIKELGWIWDTYHEDIERFIGYWRREHPNGIVARGNNKRVAVKEYMEGQVCSNYDITKTRKENIAALAEKGIDVSESYLKQHKIGSKEMKEAMGVEIGSSRWSDYRRRKEAGQVHSRITLEHAVDLYDASKTDRENIEAFHDQGYGIGLKKLREVKNMTAATTSTTDTSFRVPTFAFGCNSWNSAANETPQENQQPIWPGLENDSQQGSGFSFGGNFNIGNGWDPFAT